MGLLPIITSAIGDFLIFAMILNLMINDKFIITHAALCECSKNKVIKFG